MKMHTALQKKIKKTFFAIALLIGGWFILPAIWEQIGLHSEKLGLWRFLWYAVLIGIDVVWFITTIVMCYYSLKWLISETIHLLGTIWKSIVHLEA